jgi:hypothetical protein
MLFFFVRATYHKWKGDSDIWLERYLEKQRQKVIGKTKGFSRADIESLKLAFKDAGLDEEELRRAGLS